MRRLLCLACLLWISACGDLPQPFRHAAPNPLLDPTPIAGVTVAPVIDAPDPELLAESMAAALVAENVAAVPGAPRPGRRWVEATIVDDGGSLLVAWQLREPDGRLLAQDVQRHDRATWAAPEGRNAGTRTAAAALARALRQESPLPRISVLRVAGAPGDGSAALAEAMARALRRAGATVVDVEPHLAIEGSVALAPGPPGHEMMTVTWVVRRPDGTTVATLDQSNPVPKHQVWGNWSGLASAIADAAAGGIVEVVRSTPR